MKLKFSTLLFGFIAVCMLFLLTSCSKPECKVATDCGANSECISYGCSEEGQCMKNIRKDCCGNLRCETSAGENKCNCKDCGSCAGKVTYNTTTSRGVKTIDAKYAVYQCDASNQCVPSANPELTTQLKLTGLIEERNYFKLDLLNSLSSPFNVGRDKLSIRFTLSDLNAKTVSGGVSITSVQILSGNFLMSEAILNRELGFVGDTFTQEFNIDTAQTLPEEDQQITIKIFYSYVPLDNRGAALPIKRSSQNSQISTKIPFIKG